MADARARNWLFVFYPESCPEEWDEVISSWGVTCYVSPLHDMDVKKDGELKKPHFHGVLTFEGKKSYTQVLALVSQLGCATCLVCNSIQNALRYLCHMDNPEKAQYNIDKLRTFGRADLSAVYARSASETEADCIEIINIARQFNIYEFSDLVELVVDQYPDTLFPVLRANHAFIRSFCQGMYLRSR